MDCKQPNISEKLVPFVEGALAEADRKEVQDHLPDCESCTAEVKMLRETIQHLRAGSAAGLSYRPGTNLAPEALVEYALFGEEMSPETRRRTQLTVLESTQLQDELSLLHDLERALGEKPEPEKVAIGMPAALRTAIAKTYGTGPVLALPAWKLQLIAWQRSWSRVRLGRLAMIVGMVLIVCLGMAAGPSLFRALRPSQELAVAPVPSPASTSALRPPSTHSALPTRDHVVARAATPTPTGKASPEVAADIRASGPVHAESSQSARSQPPPIRAAGQASESFSRAPSRPRHSFSSPAPPAARVAQKPTGSEQVPLFTHKVNAEDLPRYSRQLWGAQIAHSYRDGQLFVASNDAPKAWSVLHQNDRQALASKREATRTVASTSTSARPLVQAAGRAQVPINRERGRSASTVARRRYVPPPAREIAAALSSSSQAPDLRVAPRSSRATSAHREPSHPRRKPSHLALFSTAHRASREKSPKTSMQVKEYASGKVSKQAVRINVQDKSLRRTPPRVRTVAKLHRAKIVNKSKKIELALAHSDSGVTSSALQPRVTQARVPKPPRTRKLTRKPHRDEAPPLPTEVNAAEFADEAAPASAASSAAGSSAPGLASRAASAPEAVPAPVASLDARATAVANVSDTTYLNNGQTLEVVVPVDSGTPEGQKLRLGRKIALRFFSRGQIEVQVRPDNSFLITLRPARRLNSDQVDRLRTELRRVLQLSVSDSLVIRQP